MATTKVLTKERLFLQKDILIEAIEGCLGLIGNVNHGIGHGWNAAKMRGELLMDIRKILSEAIKVKDIK